MAQMLEKQGEFNRLDIIKEVLWDILLFAAAFVYWMALLLIITFMLNSIIYLSFEHIILISFLLAVITISYRIINKTVKSVKSR